MSRVRGGVWQRDCVEESYRGYTYRPEIDRDDDVKKIFHYVYAPDGTLARLTGIRHSPYQRVPAEKFHAYVDQLIEENIND